jgi:Ser/Thr protein kinase RdoA (MazF antagonist)
MGSMIQPLHILSLPRPSTLYASLSARLRRSDVGAESVPDILACFGVSLTKPVRNLAAGRRNTNVVVETTTGKKMLKGYRPQWSAETVTYTHSILDALATADFPAPRLNRTVEGESFVHYEGIHYALFDFEKGTNYSGRFLLRGHRRRLMQIAGLTLAQLHRQLQGFMPAGRHHMGFASYSSPRWRDMDWHIAKIEELKLKSAFVSDEEERLAARWLVEFSSFILGELIRLDELLRDVPLPRLIIHGDYGLHNLLFAPDGRVVPVDFELARLEWRLSDLVSCLSRFRFGKVKGIAYDFQSIRWFMEGYCAEFPLDEVEWQHFPQVWAFYRLQSAVQYWNSYFETGGPMRKLLSARDAIDQFAWALSNSATILSLQTVMGAGVGGNSRQVRR